MRERAFHILTVAFCLSAAATLAWAQEPRTPPAAAASEGSEASDSPSFEEKLPPIHLRNKDGELVPVPGLSLEEFQEILNKQAAEGPVARPRFSIQSIDAEGTAGAEHVEMAWDIQVLVNDAGWSRIPLRMAEGIIEEAPVYSGEGTHFLGFEPDAGGYFSWIRSAAGETHRLSLKVLVPISRRDAESRIKLTAPRSTRSVFTLSVPAGDQVGKLTGGASLDDPKPGASRDATEFVLRRLEGELEFAWRSAETGGADTTARLEAVSAIAARIDGRGIRYTAQLTLRSLGGDFDGFQVRLPKSAQLVGGDQPGYRLAASEADGEETSRIVQVTLDEPSAGSVECRIIAEQAYHPSRPDALVELSGFEVLGAARQWGHLGVYVVGDWQAQWGPLDSGVRRVENLPDSLRREDLVAGYEFSRQPYSLPARIVPRETRMHVDPEYLFLVSEHQVRLEARWRYRVRGAKAFTVEVDIPGWEIEELGPDSLVNLDAISTRNRSPLSIPLLQPATGTFDIVVRATRSLAEGASAVEFSLPIPRANTASPAAVVVLADDNVELRLRPDRTTGLYRQRVAPAMALPSREQEALFFRGEAAQVRFAADLAVRPRAVTVVTQSQVDLLQETGQVVQRFSYLVAHENVESVLLTAPRELVDSPALVIEFEGQRLTPRVLADSEPNLSESRLQLDLPSPRIGEFEIVARFPLELKELTPGASTVRRLPLLAPAGAKLERHELEILSSPGVRAEPRDEEWKLVATAPDKAGPVGARYETHELCTELTLAEAVEERLASGHADVERAWLRTWLGADERIDRASYRFSSRGGDLALQLPPGVMPASVLVALDGRAIAADLTSDGTLKLDLGGSGREPASRTRLLELEYRFSAPPLHPGLLSLAAPKWPEEAQFHRLYWQLLVSPREHLVAGPGDMTDEHRWTWKGIHFQREPARDQQQLETWIGTKQTSPLPIGANCYLFSGMSATDTLHLRTASRSVLLFTFSMAALAAGLALIYAPVLRRADVLLVLALMLFVAGVFYSDLAILAFQASMVGVVLALFAGWLENVVARKRPRSSVARRSSSSITKTTPIQAEEDLPVPHGSTMTAAHEIVSGVSGHST